MFSDLSRGKRHRCVQIRVHENGGKKASQPAGVQHLFQSTPGSEEPGDATTGRLRLRLKAAIGADRRSVAVCRRFRFFSLRVIRFLQHSPSLLGGDLMANKLPTFDRLINPLLRALEALGGSGSIDEIYEKVIELEKLPEDVLAQLHDQEGNSA